MMLNKIIEKLNINGSVIAIRTDTVYGLIANANDKVAIDKIYKLKNREKKKPIGIFIKSISELDKYAKTTNVSKNVYKFIDNNWPGALTVIFKKRKNIFDYLTCNKDTISIRIPNDKLIIELLNNIEFPLAQTSCNISGEKPYVDAKSIYDVFGNNIDLIVDGGKVIDNIASTIIDVSGGDMVVVREGNVLVNA